MSNLTKFTPEPMQVVKTKWINITMLKNFAGAVQGCHVIRFKKNCSYSIDEALAGRCDAIIVRIHIDGSCSVEDNGSGIPVDKHPVQKRPALEVVMTTLHAGR